jgi:hypothetical protein
LILVESLDLWVQLPTWFLICLILINCLNPNFKRLIIFLFRTSHWTRRIHCPRCINIPLLYFLFVNIINWVICLFILLVILYFHTLAESAYSFNILLFFYSRRLFLISYNIFLGNEKGFRPLRFTIIVLAILFYIFNNILDWIILKHFIEILTIQNLSILFLVLSLRFLVNLYFLFLNFLLLNIRILIYMLKVDLVFIFCYCFLFYYILLFIFIYLLILFIFLIFQLILNICWKLIFFIALAILDLNIIILQLNLLINEILFSFLGKLFQI